ncbi:MAG: hypothetical protein ACKOOG_04275 [Actinomycetota bacterium]
MAEGIPSSVRVLLAGGLTPGNVVGPGRPELGLEFLESGDE